MQERCLVLLPTLQQLITYEVHSSWWVPYLSHPTLQNWAGWYYSAKVQRKHRRALASLKERAEILKSGRPEALAFIQQIKKD